MKRKSLPHPQGSQDMGTAYTHTHVERHPWKIRVSLELTRFGLCPGPPLIQPQPPLPQAECAAWPLTPADRAQHAQHEQACNLLAMCLLALLTSVLPRVCLGWSREADARSLLKS